MPTDDSDRGAGFLRFQPAYDGCVCLSRTTINGTGDTYPHIGERIARQLCRAPMLYIEDAELTATVTTR